MTADHVVLHGTRFLCRHCGAAESFKLPIEVGALGRLAKAFVRKHRKCTPPRRP
jgi:hypothetical protein